MKKEEIDIIIESQKKLTELPNNDLVKQMDLLTEEHEKVRDIIISHTVYLDKLEELYNNIMKVYQQRNGK